MRSTRKHEKLFSMIYISTFPLTIYTISFFKPLKFMHLNYTPFCSHKNWFSIQFYFFLWKIFSLYFKFTSRIFNFPLTSLTSSVSRNRFIKEFCFFISCKRIVFYCVKSRKTTNKLNYSEHPLEKKSSSRAMYNNILRVLSL